MAQFDVFPNPVPGARSRYPYVVCLDSDLLAGRSHRVIAPLAPHDALPGRAGRLTPEVHVDDVAYAVIVPALVTLPAADLSRRVANVARRRDDLLGAVDLLFYGV
jgi:toxin CcdB